MGLAFQTYDYYDNGGGQDLKSSPTKVAEDDSSESLNIDYSTDGAFFTRNGATLQNPGSDQISGAPRGLLMNDFKKEDGTSTQVIVAGSDIYHGLTTPTAQSLSLTANLIPDLEKMVTPDDEYLFFGNGTDTNLKFNGTDWTNWSITQPSDPSAADQAAGNLSGTYDYVYSFARTVSGVIVQEGELSDPDEITVSGGRTVRITIATSSDSQVNARVLYRKSPTSGGLYLRLTTIAENSSTTYDDNTLADGTISADFNNQPAPDSAVFEEYGGRMAIRDDSRKTDLYYSKVNRPWNVPITNLIIFDAEITCIRRFYGSLIIATKRSLWVQSGDFDTNSPRRISSVIGILNNRCAVGETFLYFMGTNRKVYQLLPTDLTQDEIRLDRPLSLKIDPLFQQIGGSGLDNIAMEYYSKADIAKVMVSVPIGALSTNNTVLVFNESQSLLKNKPVWQTWDNWFIGCMSEMNISNAINLYSVDYNGFVWKLDDDTTNGDGAVINGTVTSATATTLTDTSQSYTADEHIGKTVRIISGTGIEQVRTITDNDTDTLTVAAWTTTPDTTSEFTVGGYDAIHFSNWKSVVGSYDVLKQLWYLFINLNTQGAYSIDIILQFEFDSESGTTIELSLDSGGVLWGSFIWGQALWGSQSVFTERIREYERFRAMRVGFRNREAGQPYQVNGFSIAAQNKGYYYGTAA